MLIQYVSDHLYLSKIKYASAQIAVMKMLIT